MSCRSESSRYQVGTETGCPSGRTVLIVACQGLASSSATAAGTGGLGTGTPLVGLPTVDRRPGGSSTRGQVRITRIVRASAARGCAVLQEIDQMSRQPRRDDVGGEPEQAV